MNEVVWLRHLARAVPSPSAPTLSKAEGNVAGGENGNEQERGGRKEEEMGGRVGSMGEGEVGGVGSRRKRGEGSGDREIERK